MDGISPDSFRIEEKCMEKRKKPRQADETRETPLSSRAPLRVPPTFPFFSNYCAPGIEPGMTSEDADQAGLGKLPRPREAVAGEPPILFPFVIENGTEMSRMARQSRCYRRFVIRF